MTCRVDTVSRATRAKSFRLQRAKIGLVHQQQNLTARDFNLLLLRHRQETRGCDQIGRPTKIGHELRKVHSIRLATETLGSLSPPVAPNRVETGRLSGFVFVMGEPPKTPLIWSPVPTAAMLPVNCGNKPERVCLTISLDASARKYSRAIEGACRRASDSAFSRFR